TSGSSHDHLAADPLGLPEETIKVFQGLRCHARRERMRKKRLYMRGQYLRIDTSKYSVDVVCILVIAAVELPLPFGNLVQLRDKQRRGSCNVDGDNALISSLEGAYRVRGAVDDGCF